MTLDTQTTHTLIARADYARRVYCDSVATFGVFDARTVKAGKDWDKALKAVRLDLERTLGA